MNLVSLAISILWLLIGVIIILGIVWLALYVVRMFTSIPSPVEKAVWVIVLILILIAALTMISGGGSHFRLSGESGGSIAPAAVQAPVDMRWMLAA